MSSSGNGEKGPTSPASPRNPSDYNLTPAPNTNPVQTPTHPIRNPVIGTSTPQGQRLVVRQGDCVHPQFYPPGRQPFTGFGMGDFVHSPYGRSSSNYFRVAAPVPVGDVIGSSSGGGGVREGQPSRVVRRKRQRKDSTKAGGSGDVANGQFVNICSVCDRSFNSPRALYSHLRSHRNRGWNGPQPPPTLVVQEPVDLPGMNLRDLADAAVAIAEGEREDAATSAAREVVVVEEDEIEEGEIVEEAAIGVQQRGDGEAVAGQEIVPVVELERVYLVPDLNETPPPEDQ